MSGRPYRLVTILVMTVLAIAACSLSKKVPKPTPTPVPSATPTPTPKPPLAAAQLATLVALPSDLPRGWSSAPEVTQTSGNDALATCLGMANGADRFASQSVGNVISSSDGFQVRSFAASYRKTDDARAMAKAIVGSQATACVNQQTVALMTAGAKPTPVNSNVVMAPPPIGSTKSLKAIGTGSASFPGAGSAAVTFFYAFFYAGSTEVEVTVVGLQRTVLPDNVRAALLASIGKRLESLA